MKKPIKFLIILTAATLVILVAAFFFTNDGAFSLNAALDKILGGREQVSSGEDLKIPADVSVSVKALNDSYTFDVDLEIEQVLFDYFTLYYKALGSLSDKNAALLPQVYAYTSIDEPFDMALLKHMINIRSNSAVTLTFPACHVSFSYDSAAVTDTIAEITLTEYADMNFDGLGGRTSSFAGRRHYFVLKHRGGAGDWRISRHTEHSLFADYAGEVFGDLLMNDGFTRGDLDRDTTEAYAESLPAKLGQVVRYSAGESNADSDGITAEYPYDRDAAVAYAHEWTIAGRVIRNGQNFATKHPNDVSFVSQCVFAGGIPMDSHGDISEQWKYYGDWRDFSFEKQGYSQSWLDGDAFLLYLLGNAGFGMKAALTGPDDIAAGDIVQLIYESGGRFLWEGLITGRSGGELIVTGNDDDVKDFPLSAVGIPNARLIKIYGYDSADF